MNLLLQTQANTVAAWVSGACLLSKLVQPTEMREAEAAVSGKLHLARLKC